MLASKRVLFASLGMLAAGSTASATDVTGALTFVGITPCRIIETRTGQGFSGANGPPSLVANATRTFQITGTVTGLPAQCGVPTTAAAISVNFTVTGFAGAGDIRVFPAGGTLPLTSIVNFQLENIANATTVPLGPSGGGQNGIAVRADAVATDFIADVNGYYVSRPFTTLESGRTLTGSFAAAIPSTVAGDFYEIAWGFQVPLASAPTGTFIPVGGAPTASCPGTAANPQALPGNVCLYESSQANRTFFCIVKEGTSSCGSDSFGIGVAFNSVAAGSSRSRGTWAVTAP